MNWIYESNFWMTVDLDWMCFSFILSFSVSFLLVDELSKSLVLKDWICVRQQRPYVHTYVQNMCVCNRRKIILLYLVHIQIHSMSIRYICAMVAHKCHRSQLRWCVVCHAFQEYDLLAGVCAYTPVCMCVCLFVSSWSFYILSILWAQTHRTHYTYMHKLCNTTQHMN